jgi:hypothetical protein
MNVTLYKSCNVSYETYSIIMLQYPYIVFIEKLKDQMVDQDKVCIFIQVNVSLTK